MLKKFFEWSGPIAICILFSMVLVRSNYLVAGNNLDKLLGENLFGVMTSILGLSLASITFFMTKIIDLEEKYNCFFVKTRKEIKDNLILSISCVVLYLFVIIFSSHTCGCKWEYLVKIISLSLLLLQLLSFIEVCFTLINFKGIKKD